MSQEALQQDHQLEVSPVKEDELKDLNLQTSTVAQENKKTPVKHIVNTKYLPLALKTKKVRKSQVKITYHKVKKAKAYALYMAKGKGSYQLIRKQKKLNYMIKHLKKDNYRFYVEAYHRHNQKIA